MPTFLHVYNNSWAVATESVSVPSLTSFKSLACPGGVFKERIGPPRPILNIKLIKKALDKRKCEEFEMALQHKSKLRVCKELKWEIGFEEYLECVKGVLRMCKGSTF